MKKNVIFLTIDSVCVDYINSKYGKLATPFLSSLNHTLKCNNLYSQGPFTEAGTKALLTGCNVLDDSGYLNRINDAKSNIYKVFKQNGYQTHVLMYPDFSFNKKLRCNIDHLYPTSHFNFLNLWDFKIGYYSKLYKNDDLSEKQMKDLVSFIDLMFDGWLFFLSHKNEEDYELLKDKAGPQYYLDNYALLKNEYDKYITNKDAYIKELLIKEKFHPLFNIETINIDSDINFELLCDFVLNKNKAFLKQCEKKHLKANVGKLSLREKIGGFVSWIFNGFKFPNNKFGNFIKSIVIKKDFYCVREVFDKKIVASCRKQFNLIEKIINENVDDNPLLITAHVEEPHYFNIFYSFDCNNIEYLCEEFDIQKRFVPLLDKDFDGSLLYFMSLRYIDYCIEKLFSFLQSKSLLDKYQIVITADHGSSYNFLPLRDTIVNNFHKENYHIPLWLFDSDIEDFICDSFYTSKDILYTLYCHNNMLFDSLNGKNMFDDKTKSDNNYALVEYMGPGCPDMRVRELWMAIRNSEYLISLKCPLTRKVTVEDVFEVYDLQNDKEEEHNLVGTIQFINIQPLINVLFQRHDLLRERWMKNE